MTAFAYTFEDRAPGDLSSLVELPPPPAVPPRKSAPAVMPDPLPHSLEAEHCILGSMLLAGADACALALSRLAPEMFYDPAARETFRAASELVADGRPLDMVTLMERLRETRKLDTVGGVAFLATVVSSTAVPSNIGEYADTVCERWKRRRAIDTLARLSATVKDSRNDEWQGEVATARLELDTITRHETDAVPLIDYVGAPVDTGQTLLGNRFLCREGSLLIVAPSGVGKSSSSIQQDIAWACGREAFGIQPARPLRILTVQAENDDGDIAEMATGVMRGMDLSPEELDLVRSNALIVSHKALTGSRFLAEFLRPLLRRTRPDILRIDPFQAFLGGDPVDTDVTSAFCRNGLNPLLEEFQCGLALVHHTPKTNKRDTSTWKSADWMYAGAGAADLTNWARAVIVIDPTQDPHVFRFIAAKRGRRVGWEDDEGDAVQERWFAHAREPGVLKWVDATPEQIDAATATKKEQGRGGQREGAGRKVVTRIDPTPDQVLTLFAKPPNPFNPRTDLMTVSEFRAAARAKGWHDYQAVLGMALRTRTLEMASSTGRTRTKLVGKPAAVEALIRAENGQWENESTP
jgi:hypothetical protein